MILLAPTPDIPCCNIGIKAALMTAALAQTHLSVANSLREKSYSRLLTLEAERLLQHFGAETRVFNPHGLPMVDSCPADHPKVQELRQLSTWSEG